MRRKLEDLQATLRGFVTQRANLLLVVSAQDTELVYVLKSLEGLDQTSDAALFFLFAEPFHDASSYVGALIKKLALQLGQAEKERASRGELPWPSMPALCNDLAAAPDRRLRAAVDHLSGLISPQDGQQLIWGLVPLRIIDRQGYQQLVNQFVPGGGPEPWMSGLRVIARDDRENPFMLPALRVQKAPGVLLYELDMSPAALNDALVREAADKSHSLADRMQALVQLAGLDYAYKRYPQALEKYRVLYSYHAAQNSPTMQALVLQGMGDVLRRTNDLKGSRLKYHQALTLALATQTLPLILHLTFALGEISLETNDNRDAAGYFGLTEKIAGRLVNPFARAEALEKQGIAYQRLGKQTEAMVAWIGAAALCKSFAYHQRHCTVLDRLIPVYKSLFLSEQRRACEADLEAAQRALRASAPATHDHSRGSGARS